MSASQLFFTLFLSAALLLLVGWGWGVALWVQTTNSEHPPPPSCYHLPYSRGKFPLVATYGRNTDEQPGAKVGREQERVPWQMARCGAAALGSDRVLLLLETSNTLFCIMHGVGCLRGCITSVLLWEDEWPVFVLPVCRPLAQ